MYQRRKPSLVFPTMKKYPHLFLIRRTHFLSLFSLFQERMVPCIVKCFINCFENIIPEIFLNKCLKDLGI